MWDIIETNNIYSKIDNITFELLTLLHHLFGHFHRRIYDQRFSDTEINFQNAIIDNLPSTCCKSKTADLLYILYLEITLIIIFYVNVLKIIQNNLLVLLLVTLKFVAVCNKYFIVGQG